MSSSYSELYNIQSFFEGFSSSFSGRRGNSTLHTPTVISHSAGKAELPANADGSPFDNDRALRDIAEAGSEWRQRHLRREDMEVSLYFVAEGTTRAPCYPAVLEFNYLSFVLIHGIPTVLRLPSADRVGQLARW